MLKRKKNGCCDIFVDNHNHGKIVIKRGSNAGAVTGGAGASVGTGVSIIVKKIKKNNKLTKLKV